MFIYLGRNHQPNNVIQSIISVLFCRKCISHVSIGVSISLPTSITNPNNSHTMSHNLTTSFCLDCSVSRRLRELHLSGPYIVSRHIVLLQDPFHYQCSLFSYLASPIGRSPASGDCVESQIAQHVSLIGRGRAPCPCHHLGRRDLDRRRHRQLPCHHRHRDRHLAHGCP